MHLVSRVSTCWSWWLLCRIHPAASDEVILEMPAEVSAIFKHVVLCDGCLQAICAPAIAKSVLVAGPALPAAPRERSPGLLLGAQDDAGWQGRSVAQGIGAWLESCFGADVVPGWLCKV